MTVVAPPDIQPSVGRWSVKRDVSVQTLIAHFAVEALDVEIGLV
jgi:hypothetical protein